MPRQSSGAYCPRCGEDRPGNYCPRCGLDQSASSRRHWSIITDHERAARTAVRKAKYDRRLYGAQNCPPLSQMVVAAAEGMAEPESDSVDGLKFFPAVGPRSEHGLSTELVVEMALDRLESG